jgi:ClpP class serine protease
VIRNDLSYALKGGKPLAIDPMRVVSFLRSADIATSNPSIAYALSNAERLNDPKAKQRKGQRGVLKKHADEDDDNELMSQMLKPPESPYITVDGVGVIPIKGVIGKGLTYIEKCLGCCDIEDIAAKLEEWKDDPFVQEIVFDINSGGGGTTGLEELAKVIREYPKMTTGFADEDCQSAAYWLGSQCKRLLGTPSSSWGSIGIYVTIIDESVKFAEDGKTVIVIKDGDYKGAGIEGTTLSEKQTDWLQYEVTELKRRFVRDIRSVRAFVQDLDMQGQSFYGDIAASKGMITGVVQSFKEAMDSIKSIRQTSTMIAAGVRPTETVVPFIG